MKIMRKIISFLMLVLCFGLLYVPCYATESHGVIPGEKTDAVQDVEPKPSSSKLIEPKANTSKLIEPKFNSSTVEPKPNSSKLIKSNREPFVESEETFSIQRKWLAKIPDEIIPAKMKGYIIQAIYSTNLFLAVIFVVALAVAAVPTTNERQREISLRAIKVLIVLFMVVNLFSPILHFGLWIVGAI